MPFSRDTIRFLVENRLADSREWFEEHKPQYRQYVLEPLRELVTALTPCMLDIDSQLTTEPKVDKTICRIWRDTRYSHDKSLYRDNMWIVFKRGKMHDTTVPGLHFEITCDGFNYGTGFYHASTGYMETLRSLVLAGDTRYLRAEHAYNSQKIYQMLGECYRRPHFSDRSKSEQLWLERRNISFEAESADAELLFSNHLAEKLSQDFALLRPIYDFLLYAAELQKQKEALSASLSQNGEG